MLESQSLTQTIKSLTRNTLSCSTLIDFIITSCDDLLINHSEVIPFDHISDNDLTYKAINITLFAILLSEASKNFSINTYKAYILKPLTVWIVLTIELIYL